MRLFLTLLSTIATFSLSSLAQGAAGHIAERIAASEVQSPTPTSTHYYGAGVLAADMIGGLLMSIPVDTRDDSFPPLFLGAPFFLFAGPISHFAHKGSEGKGILSFGLRLVVPAATLSLAYKDPHSTFGPIAVPIALLAVSLVDHLVLLKEPVRPATPPTKAFSISPMMNVGRGGVSMGANGTF